jgi:TonB-linked SusC/RagA family outer membrane protein
MKNIKKTIILVLALFSFIQVYSQDKVVIRGRVINKTDKTAIIGANVIEYDSGDRVISGTVTDVNGGFVYEMRNSKNVVKVSVIGFTAQKITVDPTKSITVELTSTDVAIGQVTVSAQALSNTKLTTVADRDNASSSVKVDLAQMQDMGVISAADALQGRVSGLDILGASGDPGSGSNIVIRGLSSMKGSSPLIVVDGVPQYGLSSGDLSSATQEDIGKIINIAVQDIKSIEVLKDVASTSMYGSRGADGVLLIETYRGRMGKVQFDYTFKNTVTFQPRQIPMLNGDEYIMLQLEEWHNSRGVFTIPPEIAYDKDYVDFYNYSQNTDWIKAITQNGKINDHFFKISGGGEKTRYYTSFSYVDDIGTTINTENAQFSTRISLDYFLSKKIFFSVLFNYNRNTRDANAKDIRGMAYQKAPNMSIMEYDAEGNLTGEYFTPINSYQGNGSSYFNPVAMGELGKQHELKNSLQNTFVVRYKISDYISFNQQVTMQYEGLKWKNFIPYNAQGTDWLGWEVNKSEERNNITSSIQTESRLIFSNPFKNKNHEISGSIGWITNQSSYEGINIQSNKIPSVNINDPAINAQINWIGSNYGQGREVSSLGDFNYKFKDTYMFSGNYRLDANAAFGRNNRWLMYYGLKFGWRFSKEKFLESWKFLGESMLRFNVGRAGSQPSNPYVRYATYETAGSGNYINNPAIVPTSIELRNIRAESVWSYEFGGEINLFKDRIYIDANIYQKISTDMLFSGYSIPSSSGFGSLGYLNGGRMENKGWDMSADIRIINKKDLRFGVNFNASQNSNTFTDLPGNYVTERDISLGNQTYPKRVALGKSVGSFFGFRYLGVWPSDESVKATDADGNVIVDTEGVPIPFTYLGTYNFRGGDAKYEDINHDGRIDLADVVYIGNSNPSFYGGFATNLTYKNFTFTVNFNYRLGFDIVNGTAMNLEGMNGRNNQSKAVLRRWRAQGQDFAGMLPRACLDNPANNLGSDRYVQKGDFVRLNDIKISYRLKKELCDKLKIRSANIALSARKLLTFTKYTGQDPEIYSGSDPFWMGVDNARTPPTKQVTLNLSVGF